MGRGESCLLAINSYAHKPLPRWCGTAAINGTRTCACDATHANTCTLSLSSSHGRALKQTPSDGQPPDKTMVSISVMQPPPPPWPPHASNHGAVAGVMLWHITHTHTGMTSPESTIVFRLALGSSRQLLAQALATRSRPLARSLARPLAMAPVMAPQKIGSR